jgi:DNA-binding CsgD family transcriptional regulator
MPRRGGKGGAFLQADAKGILASDMAKTLFFIEASVFAALALVFPLIASEAAAAFIMPAALSLVLPLACAMAVWPPLTALRALGSAFSAKDPGPEAAEQVRILAELGALSRAAAALGLLFAIVAICRAAPFAGGIETWTLLGVYLAAYALLNAMLWRILAAVVGREAAAPGEHAARDALGANSAEEFAAAHGLTPREMETAARIARGMSYKETAHELGITIRTVKAHMGSVYEKTGAASNVALALLLRDESAPWTKVQ